MKQRWLVVAIGLPLLLLVLLACPAWATMLLVCAIAGIAAYELLHTAGKNVPTSIYLLTVAAAAAYEVLLYHSEWTFFGTVQTVTVLRWAFLMLLSLEPVISQLAITSQSAMWCPCSMADFSSTVFGTSQPSSAAITRQKRFCGWP